MLHINRRRTSSTCTVWQAIRTGKMHKIRCAIWRIVISFTSHELWIYTLLHIRCATHVLRHNTHTHSIWWYPSHRIQCWRHMSSALPILQWLMLMRHTRLNQVEFYYLLSGNHKMPESQFQFISVGHCGNGHFFFFQIETRQSFQNMKYLCVLMTVVQVRLLILDITHKS